MTNHSWKGRGQLAWPIFRHQSYPRRLTVSRVPVSAAPTLPRAVIAERGIRVHVFVRNRLDYCNSLLYGVSDELLKLQVIQNAAARVVTGARKFDHITLVLCELHWLPVRQRIRFKLAMIVYKCLHGLAPSYVADDCVLVSFVASRWHLRSADTRKLVVWRTRHISGTNEATVVKFCVRVKYFKC